MQNIITTLVGLIGVGGYSIFGAGLKSWEDWTEAAFALLFFYFAHNTTKYSAKTVSIATTACGIAFSIVYAIGPLLANGTAPTAVTIATAAAIAGFGWATNNTAAMGPLQAFIDKLNLKPTA